MSSICFNKILDSHISKLLLSCALLIALGCNAQSTSTMSNSPTPTTTADASSVNSKSTHQGYPNVKFSATQGDFVVELYPDKAPKTVANFLQYVKDSTTTVQFSIGSSTSLWFKVVDMIPGIQSAKLERLLPTRAEKRSNLEGPKTQWAPSLWLAQETPTLRLLSSSLMYGITQT